MQDRIRAESQPGLEQLANVWRSVHQEPVPEPVHRIAKIMLPHGVPDWRSFVSDDGSPYEFSLLLGGEPEVRLMVEAVPKDNTNLRGSIDAGWEMAKALVPFGARLERLEQLADLFLPSQPPTGAFALWLGACFARDGSVAFKAYLNPCLFGPHKAPSLMQDALQRLGFSAAWPTLTKVLSRRAELDELRFLSIDLHDDAKARFKVYGFLRQANAVRFADAVSIAGGDHGERVERFCDTVAGGKGMFAATRDPGVAFAFVDGEPTPRTATVHVPVRAFAPNDRVAKDRMLDVGRLMGIDTSHAVRALDALAQRPLEQSSGAISWLGLRIGQGSTKLNVYLAPQSNSVASAHAGSVPQRDPDDLLAVVQNYEQFPITLHPLFERIRREGITLPIAYTLLANIQLAIANDFARRLASVVARVEEDDIRSMLAKQLDDELGHGDPARTHKRLFARLVDGLAPSRPSTSDLLQPGEQLFAWSDEIYLRRSPYEGFGATLIMECVGKQFDIFLAESLRRGGFALPPTVLEWLTLHEALEVDHVDESIELASMVPSGWKRSLAARGAQELADAIQQCLDGLYSRCFP